VEFRNVIADRRAVREYQDRSVDRTTIENLIGAAILAPSAMNLQPWTFAVLLDRGRIDSYAQRARNWLLTNLSATSRAVQLRAMLEAPHFSIFYHAPALVMVLARSAEEQSREDCCLAAENLMLAARAQELGSCWIGLARPWLDLPATKVELGLAEHVHVVAPIVLGHPKAWPESHGRNPPDIRWL
jgi:nitroreductase